jgi:hypothetical protein
MITALYFRGLAGLFYMRFMVSLLTSSAPLPDTGQETLDYF